MVRSVGGDEPSKIFGLRSGDDTHILPRISSLKGTIDDLVRELSFPIPDPKKVNEIANRLKEQIATLSEIEINADISEFLRGMDAKISIIKDAMGRINEIKIDLEKIKDEIIIDINTLSRNPELK